LGRIVEESDATLLQNQKLIEFEISHGSDEHYEKFQDGFYKARSDFSRHGPDSYDFRWVIDILGHEVPHGVFKAFNHAAPVTMVVVPHSLFYTKRVTADSLILAPCGKKPEEDGFVLGRTNEAIGAAIYSSKPEGGIKIKGDKTSVLKHVDMSFDRRYTHEIMLVNMDEEKINGSRREVSKIYGPGDFNRYYDVLEVTGTKQQIFSPRRDRFRNEDGDCAPGFVSNIDSLMPLTSG
jgi:hypothetical protein